MSIDERLAGLRAELDEEVSGRIRTPAYADIVGRHVRRRRTRLATGGVAVVAAAAAVVGGVLATVPGGHPNAVPPAGIAVSPSPGSSGPQTAPPATAPGQTYPAPGRSYVVVPDGSQLAWTDLKTGAHGHFGPSTGQVSSPSVSADGRRVAYLEQTAAGTSVGVWDLDAAQGATSAVFTDQPSAPAISPDGSRVVWVEAGDIRVADLGPRSEPAAPNGDQMVGTGTWATWSGDGGIAYLPTGSGTSGQCAVQLLAVAQSGAAQDSSPAVAPPRCLLPTATLQSVFASDGSTWQVNSLSGSADGGLLALGVTTADGTQHGIGLLSTTAEATPFRVLPASIVTESGPYLFLGPPVLIGGGSRVVYQQASGGGNAHVMSIAVTSGVRTEITAAFGGDLTLGLGATSG